MRCLLADTPLTFIGAHLPSGGAAGDAGRRDAAVKDALIRGLFGDGKTAVAPAWAGRARLSAAVADADVSFFFGDLNYRLLARDDAARRALAAGDGDKLVLLDELAGGAAAARQCPLALRPHGGWREGRLSFAPTYKKVPRTGGGLYVGDDADADASADATASRTPAWTDRVLWREKGALDGGGAAAAAAAGGHTTPPSPSPPPRRASLLWYDAAPGVDVSDHTPVAACFEIAVRSIDAAALTTAADAARRAADAAEQASTPRVALTPKNIDFGTLERGEVARGALVVTNTGGVPAAWCFSPLDGSLFADGGPPTPRPCPVWADLHPGDGLLAPGESACVQVVVTAGAGPRGAANVVAARGGGLDAVLVLRADGGNDEFVAVGGRVRPSCLGLAPSTLATLDRPLVPDDSWGAELPPAPGTLPSPVRTVSGLGDAAAAAAVVAAAAAAPRPPPASLPPVRTASGVVADAAAAPSPAPPSSTAAPPSAASSGGEFYSPASSLASGASTPGPQSASGLPSPFGGGGSDAAKPPSPRPSRFAPPGTVDGAQAEPAPAVVEPQPPADPPSSAPTTPRTTHLHGLDAPAPGDEAVPPELRALTSFLLFAAGASTTPALLAYAADRARRAASAAGGGGWVDVGVDSLLKALDRGRALDEACTHPADAAAALLTLLACLPSPLIPAAAAAPTARGIVPPPAALGDVLLASLPVAEWATLKHVARVLKVIASGGDAAAAPADATTAVATLATSIADFLLGEPPAPTRVSAAGGGGRRRRGGGPASRRCRGGRRGRGARGTGGARHRVCAHLVERERGSKGQSLCCEQRESEARPAISFCIFASTVFFSTQFSCSRSTATLSGCRPPACHWLTSMTASPDAAIASSPSPHKTGHTSACRCGGRAFRCSRHLHQ